MTVLVTTTVPLDVTVYDQIIAALGPSLAAAPGFRAHVAYAVPEGFAVAEVWDTEAHHQAFFSANVAPNLPPGATVAATPLRNTMLAGAAAASA
jgi:hypothetical protein